MTKIHGRDSFIGRREATVAGDGRRSPAMIAGKWRRKATVAGDGRREHAMIALGDGSMRWSPGRAMEIMESSAQDFYVIATYGKHD